MREEKINDHSLFSCGHPKYRSRFYLAIVFATTLLPAVLFGLILGFVTFILPLFLFLFWLGSRVIFAYLIGNVIVVSDLNYPRIDSICRELKFSLNYDKKIYIFVIEQGHFNAYMSFFFFRRAIFLTSEILEAGVSDDEVRWLTGRFVGYLRTRKQAGMLGWIIRAAQYLLVFNFFIFPYERAMVYTGDRMALLAIRGDVSTAVSVMQKLFVGRQLGYSLNPEGIINQQRLIKGSFFSFLSRLTSSFPHMTARYVDLIVFSKAFFPAQYARFEAANPGLPADLMRLGASKKSGSAPPLSKLSSIGGARLGWLWAGGTLTIIFAILIMTWNNSMHREAANASLVSTPPNVHKNSGGQFEPDIGCKWSNNIPNDLSVICAPEELPDLPTRKHRNR